MILVALFTTFLAVYLIQKQGRIVESMPQKIMSLLMFILSGFLFSFDYGILRGIFILIGLASLFGTLFTLLRYKLERSLTQ